MSLEPVARLNDPSSHGGHVITASSKFTLESLGVARNGDLHECPIQGHGVTPLTATTTVTSADGRPVVRVGDRAGCGAIIVAGSPSTSSN